MAALTITVVILISVINWSNAFPATFLQKESQTIYGGNSNSFNRNRGVSSVQNVNNFGRPSVNTAVLLLAARPGDKSNNDGSQPLKPEPVPPPPPTPEPAAQPSPAPKPEPTITQCTPTHSHAPQDPAPSPIMEFTPQSPVEPAPETPHPPEHYDPEPKPITPESPKA